MVRQKLDGGEELFLQGKYDDEAAKYGEADDDGGLPLLLLVRVDVGREKEERHASCDKQQTDSIEFAGIVIDGLLPLSIALTFGHQSHVLGLVVVVHEETKERQRDGRRNDAKDAIALTEARSFEEGRGHVTRDPSGDDVRRNSIGDYQALILESRCICDEDMETKIDAIVSNQWSVKGKSQSDRLIKTSAQVPIGLLPGGLERRRSHIPQKIRGYQAQLV